MSAMIRTTPGRAYIEVRPGTFAAVDVYRDGDVVTVVGEVAREIEIPGVGVKRTFGKVVSQYSTLAAYEDDKRRAYQRAPLAYTRIVGRLGVDDDARNAPPLPAAMRELLPASTGVGADRGRARALMTRGSGGWPGGDGGRR